MTAVMLARIVAAVLSLVSLVMLGVVSKFKRYIIYLYIVHVHESM